MRIEVINTGTELLLGKVVNTHASFLGQELFKLGLRVQRQTTIPDGDEIGAVLKEAFPRSDVILITGGLGPTNDDLTREIVADLLELELHPDQEILDHIETIFRQRGLKQNRSNDRQAMVPDGAVVLPNPNGTAPGLLVSGNVERGIPHLFLLPGPPRELIPMYFSQVKERLVAWAGSEARAPLWKNFRIYGVGESTLATKLEPLLGEIEGLELGYCARLGEVDLRLIGSPEAVEKAAEIIRRNYRRQIMTESEDPIEKVIVELLSKAGETVSTAESCTGGLIASTVTDASGSSAVFQQGYVTYSNESKSGILGVPAELIEENGAVSDPVVRAMAEGCLRVSGADHAIAVSGIAGPTGGSKEKPVGTVYLGVAGKNHPVFSGRYFFPGDRSGFKLRTVRLALDHLRQRLQGFPLDS